MNIMHSEDLEELVERQQKQIKELMIRIETLDRDMAALHKELNLTPSQLTTFLNDKSNFTEAMWQELQNHKKVLNERLLKELNNIPNPQKTKQKLKDLHLAQNWIRMR